MGTEFAEHIEGSVLDDEQLERSVSYLLRKWRLGDVPALYKAAKRAATFIGSEKRPLMTGKLIARMGLADEDVIERALARKPPEIKALQWLINSQVSNRIQAHSEEILCIQQDYLYLQESFDELAAHPKFIDNDCALFKRHRSELNELGMLPYICNDDLLLIFDSADRCTHFLGLGKIERARSELVKELAGIVNSSPEMVQFKTAVASTALYNALLENLTKGQASLKKETDRIIREEEGRTSAVMQKLVRIISDAISKGVNDVAIEPDYVSQGAIVYFSINKIQVKTQWALSAEERLGLINILLTRSGANPNAGRVTSPRDGSISFTGRFGEAFMRLSFIPLEKSRIEDALSVSIRVLPKSEKTIELDKLGIPSEVESELVYFLQRASGLIVIAGPTNSGKSTTIGGMLCRHYEMYGDRMKRISVENPVERILPGVNHVDVEQHHYGVDELGKDKFSSALRAILRHNPDVIFVGEVRDKESCTVTIDAANTGHLVMTTTHANNCIMALRRLASFMPEDREFDLISNTNIIMAQRLVRLVCQKCSSVEPVTEVDMENIKRLHEEVGFEYKDKEFKTKRVANTSEDNPCVDCKGGYSGQTGAHGLFVMNARVRELLLSGEPADLFEAERVGTKVSLYDRIYELYKLGKTEIGSLQP